MNKEKRKNRISQGQKSSPLDLSYQSFENLDLSGYNLSHIDFHKSTFKNVLLNKADLSHCNLENTLFTNVSMKESNLQYAQLKGADLRGVDLWKANISYANLFAALLEGAILDSVISNKETQFYTLYCPEKGAFIGYKKCFNNRIVQLLIPKDAKRTSATMNSCRCNKAKVLSITSLDGTIQYKNATSFVDSNFVYRVGQYVYVPDFNENRWVDSTTGIHFWLTRKEAIGYM